MSPGLRCVIRIPGRPTGKDRRCEQVAVDTHPIWIVSMANSCAMVGSAMLTAERSKGIRNPDRIAIKSAVLLALAGGITSVGTVGKTG